LLAVRMLANERPALRTLLKEFMNEQEKKVMEDCEL
jgi:phosphoribosylcarboxyaminoimidazole (NCAIR) mutase